MRLGAYCTMPTAVAPPPPPVAAPASPVAPPAAACNACIGCGVAPSPSCNMPLALKCASRKGLPAGSVGEEAGAGAPDLSAFNCRSASAAARRMESSVMGRGASGSRAPDGGGRDREASIVSLLCRVRGGAEDGHRHHATHGQHAILAMSQQVSCRGLSLSSFACFRAPVRADVSLPLSLSPLPSPSSSSPAVLAALPRSASRRRRGAVGVVVLPSPHAACSMASTAGNSCSG